MSSRPTVRIHYHRPHRETEIFTQELVLDGSDVKVTLAREMELESPMEIEGEVVLEAGSDVVWFTFPGLWHDIGRFHRADGTFTGLYANVLTPPTFDDRGVWRTTDLYLDVWWPPDGDPHLLDEAQLEEAETRGWIEAALAERAREEARSVMEAARTGRWPPVVVQEWDRTRVLRLTR